ncbi:MAG: carboxypeptidase regulatory-like domain-containing protein, partial [Planctomycetes bacterium]|nr:carboxypeptidase regulatory-like domain-containing protein [Planctomycetota bacterium]
MKKLQSADYIFIVGLIILVGIAGSIIFLIMSADSVDTSEIKTNQNTFDDDDDDDEINKPVSKDDKPYRNPKKKIHLDDTIIWALYEQWTPAKKYEVALKHTISGTITDAKGEGIEYVEVGITPLAVYDNKAMPISAKAYDGEEVPKPAQKIDAATLDLASIKPAYKTRTDSMGKFEFPYFAGYYMIFVKKQFYYEQKQFFSYDGNNHDFRLERWGTLIGRILDTNGFPINDFMISIFNAKGKKVAGNANLLLKGFEGNNFKIFRYTYHIGNRRFGMYLPAGKYDVLISAKNYNELQVASFKIDRNQEIEETFTLFSDTMLKGRITLLDKPDFGIAHARISLQETGSSGYKVIRNTVSDENGNFNFHLARAGKYLVSVAHQNYGVKKQEVKINEGEVLNLEIKLEPGTYLQGYIKNEKGEPIEYARINLNAYPTKQNLGYVGKNQTTDNKGKFLIPNLRAGTHRLQVYSKQYYFNHQEFLTLVEGENTVEVAMIKGVTLKIKLMSDGPIPENLRVDLRRNIDKSPLPQLNISEKFPFLWSKAELSYTGMSQVVEGSKFGVVEITGVYPGPYFINIRHNELVEIYVPIEIPEKVKEVTKNLSITSGFAISGTVKDKNGQIITTAAIRILADGIQIKQVRLNAEGKFYFQGLGKKTYNLIVEARNYKGIDKEIRLTSSLIDQEFILDEGETLKGIVFDPDGKPVQGRVSIKLIAPPRGEYERYPIVQTDQDGRFELRGLNKGKFMLEVTGTKYIQAKDLEVNVPGEIEIHLTNGLRVFGVIKDFDNKPIKRATVVILKTPKRSAKSPEGSENGKINDDIMDSSKRVGSMPTNENGEYSISGIKSGDYTIIVYHGNVPVNKKIVSLNSDLEHNVILDQTYELSGNIKFTNGKIPSHFFIKVVRKDDRILGSAGNIDSKKGDFTVKGLTSGIHTLILVSHHARGNVDTQEISKPQL